MEYMTQIFFGRWRLLTDPFIMLCAGSFVVAHAAIGFLEPTITTWIADTMPETADWLVGAIWFPALFPNLFGVYVTARLLKEFPRCGWYVTHFCQLFANHCLV